MSKKQITVQPQAGKQSLAFNIKVDFLIYGGARGSGKSEFITMKPLQYLHEKDARFIFFRKQFNELVGGGSLWEKSNNYYRMFNAKSNKTNLTWEFPGGMTVQYSHLFQENDVESHRGKSYSGIFIDELTQFSSESILFLTTCLRSSATFDSFMIATCNPDPDSWVFNLVSWYLDDRGFPDKEKDGQVRYFVIRNGDFLFGESEEFFKENYPETVFIENPVTGENLYIPPKTFSFISGNIYDNPALIKAEPRYLSTLQNLATHERDRYLFGNWLSRAGTVQYWDRSWLKKLDALPGNVGACARAYDKAGAEPSQVYKYPDYTAASAKVYRTNDGEYIMVGEFCKNFREGKREIEPLGKFRKMSGDRDRLLLEQAKEDGIDCHVVFSQDPGSAGQTEFTLSSKALTNEGLCVRKDPVPSNKSKLTRFQPFAAACKNGFYYIVENTFDPETLEDFYKELESFSGEKSSAHYKDDRADAQASCHNLISRESTIPNFNMGLDFEPNEALQSLRASLNVN